MKNAAASVRQRLLNLARAEDRPFEEVMLLYAMERFLYRLSVSPYAGAFVLKGALMFRAWGAAGSRPTRDIDLLGERPPETTEELADAVAVICRQEVEPDGLIFDPASVMVAPIRGQTELAGQRVRFLAHLGSARLRLQLDVGFGDAAAVTTLEFPSLLEHPAPTLRGYSRESAVAEKFHAMVQLGMLNSRMKDFYDIRLLAREFAFDGADLLVAMRETFDRRGTTLEEIPVALTAAFAQDTVKAQPWRAFLRRSRLPDDLTLSRVVTEVAEFLGPVGKALLERRRFAASWPVGGPWRSS